MTVCASLFFAVLAGACAGTHPSEHTIGGKNVREVFADPGLAALAEASCKGDVEAVQSAARQGVNPNGRGLDGVTPLYWALNCNNPRGLEALLKAGADPNARIVGEDYTPVDIAAGTENTELLELLLAHGGDPNAVYSDGNWTALRVALGMGVAGKGWGNYEALINAGAEINLDYKGETIAEFAATMNRYDEVYRLLERGYSTRLPRLLLLAAAADRESVGAQEIPWLDKVIQKLKARGIEPEGPATDPGLPGAA